MLTNNSQQAAMLTDNVQHAAMSTYNAKQAAMFTNNAQQAAMLTNNAQQAAMSTNNAKHAATGTNDAQQAVMLTNNAQQAAMLTNKAQQVATDTKNVQQGAMGTNDVLQAHMYINNLQRLASMCTNNVPQATVGINNVPQAAMCTNNAQQATMYTNNAQQAAMYTNNVPQAAMGTNNAQQATMYTNNAQQAAMYTNNVPQAAMGSNNALPAAMGANTVQQGAMCTNNVQQVAIGANNLPQAAMSYPVQLVYDAEIQINPGAGISNYSLVIVRPQPLIMVPSVHQQPFQIPLSLLGSNSIPPWLQKYTTPASQPQNYQNSSSQPNFHFQRPYVNAIEPSAYVPRFAAATVHPGQMSNKNSVFHMQPGQTEPNQNVNLIPFHQNIRYVNLSNNDGVLANDKGIDPENLTTNLTNKINNALFANGQRIYTAYPSNFTHNAPNAFSSNMQKVPPRKQGIVKKTQMRATPKQAFVKPNPINVDGSNNAFGVKRMNVSSNEMLMANLANASTRGNATTTTNSTQTPTKCDINQIEWNKLSVLLPPTAIQNKTSQMTISNKNKILSNKNKHSNNADKDGISDNYFEAEPQGHCPVAQLVANSILTSTSLFNDKDIKVTKETNITEGQSIELQKETTIYNRKRERSCQDEERPKCKIIVTENYERETTTSTDHLSKTAGLKTEEEAEKEETVEEKRKYFDASILEEPVNQINKKISTEAEPKNFLIKKVVFSNEQSTRKKGQDKTNIKIVSDNENNKQGEDKDTFVLKEESNCNISEITTPDQNNENRKPFDDLKEFRTNFTNKTSVLKHSVDGVVIRESKCYFEKKFGSQDTANMISNNEDLEKYIQNNEIEISNKSNDKEQVNSTAEVEHTSETYGQNNSLNILSHVIDGFVIQESNTPFAIRSRNKRTSLMSRPANTKSLAAVNKNIQSDKLTEKYINKEYKDCSKASMTETDAITNDNDKLADKVKIEINDTAEKDNIINDTAKKVTNTAKMIRKRKASQKDENRDTIIKKKEVSAKYINHSDSDTTDEESDDGYENSVPEMKNPQPVNSEKLKKWSCAKLKSYLYATWCDCLESLEEQDVDGRALLLASRRQLIDVGVHPAHARTLCQFARLSRNCRL